MAVLLFPANPSDGDTYSQNGVLYTFDNGKWSSATQLSSGSFVLSTGDNMTGNLTVGDPSADVVKINAPGSIQIRRDSSTATAFGIYQGGTGAGDATITMEGNGSASFASGKVVCGITVPLTLTNGSTDTVQFRNDGSLKLGGTVGPTSGNVQINADGTATFAGQLNVAASLSGSFCTILDNTTGSNANGLLIRTPNRAGSASLKGFSIQDSGGEVASIQTDGSATFAGNITAGNVSDIKFKENITDAQPQLADVTALGNSLKNWDWKDTAPLNEELRARRFLGLIAQEAEEICPGVTYEVGEGEESYKAINHDILVMKLLGAVAELTAKNEALETRISQLEAN